MSVTIIPLIRYDKKLVEETDEKRPRTIYAYESTIKMLNQIRVMHGFASCDDVLVAAMLEYNNKRVTAETMDMKYGFETMSYEPPIAIASDPDREMNRRKRKTGKPLDSNRRKVFEAGNSDFH